MSKETGGPAFPQSNDRVVAAQSIEHSQGMTLRDYFAAKAMQSQMLNVEEMNYWGEEYSVDEMWELCACNAYIMADAMLKAREA